ncbi:hypothetical protein Scep_010666 [Stephania cephalantha]|uniref:Uncharacterized protein n=1 Tax=Stephania cephalantha TaxID=152367 RepID=A0AAP0JXR7_9MAGN
MFVVVVVVVVYIIHLILKQILRSFPDIVNDQNMDQGENIKAKQSIYVKMILSS